jgi:hypothetical protein
MYTSELARHQNRVVLFRYNLDLCCVFGVVNTPVHHHAKPSNNVYSPLTNSKKEAPKGLFFVVQISFGPRAVFFLHVIDNPERL